MRAADPAVVGDLERILSPGRVLSRPIDRLGRSTDASIYRLVPEAVVRPRGTGELRDLFAWARRRGRHLTFRAAGTSLSGQAVSDDVLVEIGPFFRGARVSRRREAGLDAARRDGRPPQSAPRRSPNPLRPRPGLDRRRDGRRHPRQQLLRDVLRCRAEQLPYTWTRSACSSPTARRSTPRSPTPTTPFAGPGPPCTPSSSRCGTRSGATSRSPRGSATSSARRTRAGTA
jgi:hypothetical protein